MNEKLELKYKEMVRLAEKSDEYAKSSFDDFKMLSALGALLAWKPILDVINEGSAQGVMVLFVGFLAILFIIAFIGLYDLSKQSVVNFYLKELLIFEKDIRKEIGDVDTSTFHVAENWINLGSKKQRAVAVRFYLLFYAIIIIFPTTILFFDSMSPALAYLISALIVVALHFNATQVVYGKSRKV
jgi:hypothetical protein